VIRRASLCCNGDCMIALDRVSLSPKELLFIYRISVRLKVCTEQAGWKGRSGGVGGDVPRPRSAHAYGRENRRSRFACGRNRTFCWSAIAHTLTEGRWVEEGAGCRTIAQLLINDVKQMLRLNVRMMRRYSR